MSRRSLAVIIAMTARSLLLLKPPCLTAPALMHRISMQAI